MLSTIFDKGLLGLIKGFKVTYCMAIVHVFVDLIATSDSATTELPFTGFVPLLRFFNFVLIFETSHFSCSTSSFNF